MREALIAARKDILVMWKASAILILIPLALSLASPVESIWVFLLFYPFLWVASIFSAEPRDSLCMRALPVRPRDLVLGRYLSSLAFYAADAIMCGLLVLLRKTTADADKFMFAALAFLFFLSLAIYVYYRFEAKAAIALCGGIFVSIIIVGAIVAALTNDTMFSMKTSLPRLAALPASAIAAIAFYMSYRASVRHIERCTL